MEPDLKDKNLRFLLMKTLADLVTGEIGESRGALMEDLLETFEKYGTKAFTVKIPGGEKVATLTISEPKPTTTIDRQALLDWCLTNRRDLTQTLYHPAREETVMTEDALKTLSDESLLVGEEYFTESGEVIEGLKYVAAGTPKSFTVRYEKGAQDRVIQAWRDGDLAGIEPGRNLPSIGAKSE